jgi:VanZ family protein
MERKNIKTAVIYWLLTFAYMGIIFWLSSRRGFNFPRLPENFDKIIHIFIYMPLSFLFYRSFNKIGIKRYVFLMAFLSATIYGITDEIHQLYVVGRDASIGDTVADFVGAFFGAVGASSFKT